MNLKRQFIHLRLGLIFCLLVATGSFFSAEGNPVSGRVIGWNYNGFAVKDLPSDLTNIVAISATAAGNYYSLNLALRNNGTVVAWGKSSTGQTRTNVPAGLQDVIAVAVGANHYMALKNDGTVVVWQTTTALSVPANVTNIAAIAAGPDGYSLALTKGGQVISWTIGTANFAVPASLNSNVVAIAASSSFFLAIKSNGVPVAWGFSNLGQTNVPIGITNLSSCAVDYIHSVGLKTDGTVVSWGANWGTDGQTNVPPGLSNVVAVAAGGVKGAHSLVLKNDGTVVSWGASQTTIPNYVSNVVAIAAGDYYNLAIVADPQIYAINFANQQPAIHFRSFAGQQYSIEYSADLRSSNWTSLLQTTLQGSGGDIVITDTNAMSSGRFYRLRNW
jgi:alpha-tubulin suppressor-like RCC1 family protein